MVHRTGRYQNNRAEVSHQHTREQERQMRRFKSMGAGQFFYCFIYKVRVGNGISMPLSLRVL